MVVAVIGQGLTVSRIAVSLPHQHSTTPSAVMVFMILEASWLADDDMFGYLEICSITPCTPDQNTTEFGVLDIGRTSK